jgi:hypothetical protein
MIPTARHSLVHLPVGHDFRLDQWFHLPELFAVSDEQQDHAREQGELGKVVKRVAQSFQATGALRQQARADES